MGGSPHISAPPPAPPPTPPTIDDDGEAEELAKQRRDLNRRRTGRTSLRIGPAINTAPPTMTGLNIP